VFKLSDPGRIAASLKRQRNRRRKSDLYRSAMSVLTLHQQGRSEFADKEQASGEGQGQAVPAVRPRLKIPVAVLRP
jgi:hypothetical protein